MLYYFTVSNFLSVADELSLDLFPYGRLRNKKSHIYATGPVNVLKAGTIYGGNGSGKSNLVRAMAFLRNFVVANSTLLGSRTIEGFRFDDKQLQEPSKFEIEFNTGNQSYRYAVALRAYHVESESLYVTTPEEEDREPELLFSRTRAGKEVEVAMNARFQVTEEDRARISIYVKELLKNSESLLHLLAGNDAFPDLRPAFDWFVNNFIIIEPDTRLMNLAEALERDVQFKQMADTLLQSLDTGVQQISLYTTDYDSLFGFDEPEQKQEVLKQLADGAPYVKLFFNGELVLAKLQKDRLLVSRVTTPHEVAGKQMMFFPEEESDGTRRVLDFLPLWHLLFSQNATVMIDEIGRSLHPNLVEQLLRVFLEGDTRGQLLFTTHDANLLQRDLFRRDEVWLMEKNDEGASRITPLTDFKIRDDLDLRKSYLNGRFGGVPQLRTFFAEDFAHHE
ncbi:MAG: ATP-binding protein [Bacteroidota bacterium]